MRAISYTAARNNLAATMKKVCDDCDPIIVTHKNKKIKKSPFKINGLIT